MPTMSIDVQDGRLVLHLAEPISDSRVISTLTSTLWYMQPEALANMIAIALGAGDPAKFSADAGDGWLFEQPRQTMERDGSDAIIHVSGPIFPKSNLMVRHSGASSLQMVQKEFRSAMADDSVKRIVMLYDSPGGATNGVQAFAQEIRDATSAKPVVSVAQDTAASAALYMAAAGSEFYGTGTAMLGSVGVVARAFRPSNSPNEVIVTSSVSPLKNQDPGTESGKASLQSMVDALASRFVSDLADFRGVSVEHVAENFGRGAMMGVEQAIAVGMADGISSRQQVISRTEAEQMSKLTAQQIAADHPEIAEQFRAEGAASAAKTITATNSAAVEAARAEGRKEGAAAELARVKSVLDTPALGHEALVREAALDGKSTSADVALKVLSAEQQARRTALDQRRTDAPPPLNPAAAAPAVKPADPTLPIDERCKAEWEASAELRSEFDSLDQYKAFAKANERGQVKILKGKAA